ncbi:hypothetical protein [Arcticibacter eurypsychrophilus]|uniref:hypothetical protein n=1 Tax=Arcticibacter eurypsychrophilus TaxID=1434752 RepID=UPI00084D1D18|nr:hypothetical protein [Arcticibacter eurypsychrophilus]
MKIISRCLLLLPFVTFFASTSAQNSPSPIKLIEFVLTPDAKDWNYTINENASVTISVLKFGVPMNNVSISYETGPEMLPADKKNSITLKKGQGKLEVGTSKQPGFRELLVSTEYKGKTYTPISGHWRFEETNQESLDWIKNNYRNELDHT